MMILNGNLLKLAIFEEITVWLVCDFLAKQYTRNGIFFSKTTGNRRLLNYIDLMGHLVAHFKTNKLVAELNRVKISKSILAFIIFFGPINIYLLSNLLRNNLQALWVNLIVTVVLQSIILSTSTVPMVRVARSAKAPSKFLGRHQLALPVTPTCIYLRSKVKLLSFAEYVDSDSGNAGFSIGTDGTVNSIYLLKVSLI